MLTSYNQLPRLVPNPNPSPSPSPNFMRLLFITQKLHGQDAFGVLWIRAFIKQGYDVRVICLEGSDQTFEFPVHSLGKENGATKFQSVLRFEKLIMTLKYDRVFVHMAPVWYALGGWWWLITGKPVYLWYTHYKMQLGVWLFGLFGKRFFAATPQSLPQYNHSEKKVVVGHGIDLQTWAKRNNVASDPHRLLMVHRLSRSKRVELVLRAMKILDPAFTLDIYGIEAEKDYVLELKNLVQELGLHSRVTFHGSIPMGKLPEIYCSRRLILNMASETIDKTMLEAMTCGCYPVTTKANAKAIGIPVALDADSPETIADFVRLYAVNAPIDAEEMYRTVERGHSLEGLIVKMDAYMREGK